MSIRWRSGVVQLGGTALGTTQVVAGSTTLAPYPTDIYSSADHLAALIERYAKLGGLVRAAIDATAEAGDADTKRSSHRVLARPRQAAVVPGSASSGA